MTEGNIMHLLAATVLDGVPDGVILVGLVAGVVTLNLIWDRTGGARLGGALVGAAVVAFVGLVAFYAATGPA